MHMRELKHTIQVADLLRRADHDDDTLIGDLGIGKRRSQTTALPDADDVQPIVSRRRVSRTIRRRAGYCALGTRRFCSPLKLPITSASPCPALMRLARYSPRRCFRASTCVAPLSSKMSIESWPSTNATIGTSRVTSRTVRVTSCWSCLPVGEHQPGLLNVDSFVGQPVVDVARDDGDTLVEHLRRNGWIRLDHAVRNRLGAQPLNQPSGDYVVATDDHVLSYRRPSRLGARSRT